MKPASLFLLILILASCGPSDQQQTTETNTSAPVAEKVSKYPEHVGDIAFDEQLDDPEFKPCQSRIPQYYALGAEYRVDNDLLMSHFGSIPPSQKNQTLYHTIRFIVNCEGEIGRLRVETMSTDYEEAQLDSVMSKAIRSSLLAFGNWPQGRDFYQYLTFKIKAGKITEVLP